MTRAARFLNQWWLWVAIAYAGMAVVIVVLFHVNSTVAQQAAEDRADERAAAISQVQACHTSADTLPDLLAILAVIEELARAARDAAAASVRIEKDSKLRATRLRSLGRYEEGLRRVSRFALRFSNDRRTHPECDALARRLGVNVERRNE